MTKEEILDAIRKCARNLGRNPTKSELWKMAAISASRVRKRFGSLGQALRDAGLEPAGAGYAIKTEALLKDWAAVARKLRKLPTKYEYDSKGRYSAMPSDSRWSSWRDVPEAFHRYARESGTATEWADVLGMVEGRRPEIVGRDEPEAEYEEKTPRSANPKAARIGKRKPGRPPGPVRPGAFDRRRLQRPVAPPQRPLLAGRPVYGAPYCLPGLGHEPVNEAGVIYVFGMLADRLGFVVERMQSTFPDCEALRQVRLGRWQRVRIEFEFESRNFAKHGHRGQGCDLIVCWTHNWPECPQGIEVIELRGMVRRMGA